MMNPVAKKMCVLFAAYRPPYVPRDNAVVGESVTLAVTVPPIIKTDAITVGESTSEVRT